MQRVYTLHMPPPSTAQEPPCLWSQPFDITHRHLMKTACEQSYAAKAWAEKRAQAVHKANALREARTAAAKRAAAAADAAEWKTNASLECRRETCWRLTR